MDIKSLILKLDNSIIFFEKELNSIRTSRANVSMLDNIIVDAMVKDIAFGDGLAYIAKGTDGVDVYQTEGTYTFTMNDYNYTFDCFLHSPCYIDNYNTIYR